MRLVNGNCIVGFPRKKKVCDTTKTLQMNPEQEEHTREWMSCCRTLFIWHKKYNSTYSTLNSIRVLSENLGYSFDCRYKFPSTQITKQKWANSTTAACDSPKKKKRMGKKNG